MKGAAYNQEGLVQFVIDSVYALAHALHNLLAEECTIPFSNCTTNAIRSGEEVLKYIRNVSFQGISIKKKTNALNFIIPSLRHIVDEC